MTRSIKISLPPRATRIAIAARVPCDPRTVEKYYDTSRAIAIVTEHHMRRALAEMGIPDPRAAGAP